MSATAKQRFTGLIGFANPKQAGVALALLLIAIGLRIGWNALRPDVGTVGEVVNSASAIAVGRGLADSYAAGQGPTAHLLPIMPVFVGAVYWLFGIKTISSEIVLALFSIGLTILRFVLFNHVFRLLGVGSAARLLALSILCLSPVFISQEAVDFRVWEGGLASTLVAVFLVTMLGNSVSKDKDLILSCLSSLTFFVNPLTGIGVFAALFIYWKTRYSYRGMIRPILLAVAALITVLAPWVVRNQVELGQPVVLRSNAGIELALAINPSMMASNDRAAAYWDRMKLHPAAGERGFDRMQAAGGEIAYSKQLQLETFDWMKRNPGSTVSLMALHGRQIFFPEPWMFQVLNKPIFINLKVITLSLITTLGFIALLFFSVRRTSGWVYLLIIFLASSLPMVVFQPIPRYLYINYPLLVFSFSAFLMMLFSIRRSSIDDSPGLRGTNMRGVEFPSGRE